MMEEILDDFSSKGRNPLQDLDDGGLDSICSSAVQHMVKQIVLDAADGAVNRAEKDNGNQSSVIVGQILDEILSQVVFGDDKDTFDEDGEGDHLLIINVDSLQGQDLATPQDLTDNNVDAENGEV